MKFKHKRVIIWGWPLYGDTFSYIFHGLYRAFKQLDVEVIWANPDPPWMMDQPPGFDGSIDFDDALIIAEIHGQTEYLPRNESSTYFIHNVGNCEGRPGPGAFSGVGRFIDWRCCPMYCWDDGIYKFAIDDEKMPWVGPGCRFEKDDVCDKFYMSWATDLLPHEINFDDRFLKRERTAWWVGNIGGGKGGLDDCLDSPPHGDNRPVLREFRRACNDAGIEFKSNCPWLNPLSFEEQKILTQKSWVVPDFRHPWMLKWGYIPCRVMKNISYGQLGATNSRGVYEFFDGNVVFNEDPYQLFFDCQEKMNDTDFILRQMKMIKDNHTYVNRAKSLIEVVNEG